MTERENSLKTFSVSGQYDIEHLQTFRCDDSDGKIWMHIIKGSSNFTFEEATEIHEKLGRLIASAKRRAGKD